MSHGFLGKPLPDDGSGLQGRPVAALEPIHAGLHEALDRIRHLVFTDLLRIAQQLVEKQRVTSGALDARQGKAAGGVEVFRRHHHCLGPAQGREIDRSQRTATQRAAPRLIDWISFDPGSHYQHGRAIDHGAGQCCEMRQLDRVGPMHILHNDEKGASHAGVPHQCRDSQLLPAVAGGIVHRVIHGTQFSRLRQVQKVVQVDPGIRAQQSIREGSDRRR